MAIDWDRLISFKILDDMDCLILKVVYGNETLSSLELFVKFKIVNISKGTLLRKLHRLNDLGLVDVINSKPLFVNNKRLLEVNIRKLLFIKQKRKELVSKYSRMKFEEVIENETKKEI